MADREKALIRKLPTGVPGLDDVLGGGLPEYSFNVLAGMPGSGKTSLAHQIMFTNATAERPALYFTILGEPPLKMLRYQQQYDFFDLDRVGEAIHFVNLAEELLNEDLDVVLERIVREVEAINPAIVVVDSFRTVARRLAETGSGGTDLQAFVQRLSLHLATWEATTFLVGEYEDEEIRSNPVFTVADGILWLTQSTELNSVVRKLQVKKMRGQREIPGLHGYRISAEGIRVFPRIPKGIDRPPHTGDERLSTGIPALDEMMGGGIPAGDVVLVAGPVGSGKSVLCECFAVTGARNGEPSVIVMFDEHPVQVVRRSARFAPDMEQLIREGMLKFLYLRPVDLSPGEMLYEIQCAVDQIGARRVALDSLAGLEVALAPTFREELRETLCRLVEALVSQGITVMPAMEVVEGYDEFRISQHHPISFAVDDIILQRYVELNGELRKIISVIKMRGSRHSHDFRSYEVTREGLTIGETLRGYRGLLQGAPERTTAFPSSGLPAESPGTSPHP